ncbi:MAG TPA: FAD-dependent monooxygenase [Thiobacillaceae bacterium]|nr:FAD-dependent monooxygenase [Thiobacillaceae bacterium]
MQVSADIVIVGAGPVGAVCALALKQAGRDPLVLEARTADRPLDDRRTLALSHGSRQILERIGVWGRLREFTPITAIHVSHKGGLGRAVLTAGEEGVPALGYVLSYGELNRALQEVLRANQVNVRFDAPVAETIPGLESARLVIGGEHPDQLAARLAIVADGGSGEPAPPAKLRRDYGQVAVVAEVKTERPHLNLAYERFTADGPVALLPRGDGYALVWVCPPEQAERIAGLDEEAFLAALQTHFGYRQGRFLQAGARGQFPLRLIWSGPGREPRMVRIGNAAQTLHPVAGQGFNLGLRDAFELARMLIDAADDDPGKPALLRRFASARRTDALGGIAFTDFLVRSFSTNLAPVRHARGLGLMVLQACPPLRHFVARRMMFGARG